MPEDKDFKRVVRARMASTGERYTTARAGLRPENATSEGPSASEQRPIPDVVPMDLSTLHKWRQERGKQGRGPLPLSFGVDWELTIDAGGRLPVLEPPELDVALVRALGTALDGVSFISFGLDVLMPAPPGSDPDDERAQYPDAYRASLAPLHQAQAELHRQLREHLGIEVKAPTAFTTGRLRREGGDVVVPGRSGVTVLIGDSGLDESLGDRLEPAVWSSLPGGIPGGPWATYGVVLHIRHEFQTRRFPTDPAPGFTGPWHAAPVVSDEFWDGVGETLRSSAALAGLPAWPLHQGKLHDPVSGSGQARSWQLPV